MLRKQCRTLVQIANLELRYVLVILPVNWPARRNEFLPRGYILGLVLVWPIYFIQDRIGISVIALYLPTRCPIFSFISSSYTRILSFSQELFEINSDFLTNTTKFAGFYIHTFLHDFFAFLSVLDRSSLQMTFTSAASLFYPRLPPVQFIYDLVRVYLRIN